MITDVMSPSKRALPATIAYLCILVALFSACLPAETPDPGVTAVEYQRAMEKGDLDTLLSLSTAEMQQQVKTNPYYQEAFPSLVHESQAAIQASGGYKEIIILEENLIDDNGAAVQIDLVYNNGSSLKVKVFLVKENGAWKFSRFEKL